MHSTLLHSKAAFSDAAACVVLPLATTGLSLLPSASGNQKLEHYTVLTSMYNLLGGPPNFLHAAAVLLLHDNQHQGVT